MASILNTLSLFLAFSLLIQGTFQQAPCQNSDVVVTQRPTGKFVGGKPEFNVTITNKCACTLLNVEVNCKGFQTAEPIPPEVLAVNGDTCLVNDGRPIRSSGPFKETVTFNYASDVQFSFAPKSFEYGCS